jgi:putative N6-adenine-specific DNA methylase
MVAIQKNIIWRSKPPNDSCGFLRLPLNFLLSTKELSFIPRLGLSCFAMSPKSYLCKNIHVRLIIKTLAGLEEVLAEEFRAIGADAVVVGKRAVEGEGDLRLMYRANLELRTALRVLRPVYHFTAEDEKQLYDALLAYNWSEVMDVDDTFAIDAVTYSKIFTHSQYVALKTKDAIADWFRTQTGRRPSVDVERPNMRFNVHVAANQVTVSLDSSGESLHKRGYRVEAGPAPINEVLAAGLVLLSGWKKDCAFIDPMCGSGTIPIEAALYAYNIPPQWYREDFAFMRWSDFDPMLWASVRTAARDAMTPFSHPILGFDKNYRSIQTAEANVQQAHLEGKVRFERRRFETLAPPAEKGIIVMNPPYDARLEERNIEGLYQMIGDRLKQVFRGYTAWVISANMDALKSLGLRTSRRIPLFNGPLECRFVQVELYEGTRKFREEGPRQRPPQQWERKDPRRHPDANGRRPDSRGRDDRYKR